MKATDEQQRQCFATALMALPKPALDFVASVAGHTNPDRNSAEYLRGVILANDTPVLRACVGEQIAAILLRGHFVELRK
jgi:hypothetical protein